MFHIRLTLAATLLVALTACGSGGLGSSLGGLNPVNGSGPICNSGTQVQLANPQPFQTGVPGNIGQIIIVANGDELVSNCGGIRNRVTPGKIKTAV